MNCEQVREFIPGALYGELEAVDAAGFERHIIECGECRRELEGFRKTIGIMQNRVRPELTRSEWRSFDRRLDAELGFPGRSALPGRSPLRLAWTYGMAAILLVGFGYFLGRTFMGDPPGPQAADAGDSAQTTAQPAELSELAELEALAWLERTRTLLIGLTNMDEGRSGSIDLVRQSELSRELYDRGNTVAAALNTPSKQQLKRLVGQLQLILLQLSNMEEGREGPAIELIRRGVDSKSILLKINLETIRAAMNAAPDEHQPDPWRDSVPPAAPRPKS